MVARNQTQDLRKSNIFSYPPNHRSSSANNHILYFICYTWTWVTNLKLKHKLWRCHDETYYFVLEPWIWTKYKLHTNIRKGLHEAILFSRQFIWTISKFIHISINFIYMCEICIYKLNSKDQYLCYSHMWGPGSNSKHWEKKKSFWKHFRAPLKALQGGLWEGGSKQAGTSERLTVGNSWLENRVKERNKMSRRGSSYFFKWVNGNYISSSEDHREKNRAGENRKGNKGNVLNPH